MELFIYELEIHGMRCGMCESHINDKIRKEFDVISVKSKRKKNLTIIKTNKELDLNKLKEAIISMGYELKDIKKG